MKTKMLYIGGLYVCNIWLLYSLGQKLLHCKELIVSSKTANQCIAYVWLPVKHERMTDLFMDEWGL